MVGLDSAKPLVIRCFMLSQDGRNATSPAEMMGNQFRVGTHEPTQSHFLPVCDWVHDIGSSG